MRRTQVKTLLKLARHGSLGGAVRLWVAEMRGERTPITVSVFGERVLVRPGTPDAKVAVNNLGKEFRPLADLKMPPDAVILDCGGYIGTASIALSKMFPGARVFVLEPSAENYAVLEKNTAGHHGITPIRAALYMGDAATSVKLRNRNTGEWGLTIVPGGDASDDTAEEVATISFDEVLEMSGAESFFIVKMDIEGAEMEPLQNHGDWLPRTEALAIELHERIVPGIEEAFRVATESRRNKSLGTDKFLSLKEKGSGAG